MTIPPLLFALAAWFLGTAAVVWLDSRSRSTFRLSFTLGAVAAAAATAAIGWLARDPSPAAAYGAFAAAIVVWGWHEMAFLMGFVAGPNRARCPADAHGWRRFRLATATVIHHEVALAAQLALLAALSWGQPNAAGALTFALLFVMRLSAKLNLFLGVANLADEVFPAHLAYLKSYFGRRRINALYPASLLLGGGIAWIAWDAAGRTEGGAATTAMLLSGLAALALVEHLLLVLPVNDARMWRWATTR